VSLIEIIVLGLVLGTDSFSVSICLGTQQNGFKKNIKISLVIGIFHVLMPLIGLYIGQLLGVLLNELAVYIGGGILIVLGGHMLYEYFQPSSEASSFENVEGFGLLVLALGVSIDALSVGLSLGTIGADIIFTSLLIGFIAFLMTGTGLFLGNEVGRYVGKKGTLIGALILLALGIRVLLLG